MKPASVRRRESQSRQAAFGFAAEIQAQPVQRPEFKIVPRWATPSAHKMGVEVAVQHPSGKVQVLPIFVRSTAHDNDPLRKDGRSAPRGCVGVCWPNAAGVVGFNRKTGKAGDREAGQWRLSPEDVAYLAEHTEA